jgi:4-cresol dehydrogenase (hydroxylating)
VGASRVITDRGALAAARTATFATDHRVLAIVQPADREEVQSCVRIANRFRIPIYPVSGGKNWGLGSRVPTCDQSVVLDLGRMNRITAYDEALGHVTVEPGVTFRQAAEYLQTRGSRHYLAVTGGPADASIVGNTVERGDSFGTQGERLDHVCGLEVILPTGECIRTGFGRFENASAAPLHRWGVGPALDGIFTQSNLGIVTSLTMWLAPKPAYVWPFQYAIADPAKLGAFVDAARELHMNGAVRASTFSFWNSYKMMAVLGRYPWTRTGGRTPLRLPTAPWVATAHVHAATAAIGAATRALVTETLSPLADLIAYRGESGTALGVPGDGNLQSAYWRKRFTGAAPLDPNRDRCGVLWLCAALPFDGASFVRLTATLEALVHAHGFEPNIGVHCASARALHCFLALMYDRDVSGEDARAMACHDAALAECVRLGFFPNRLGIHSMAALPANAPYAALMRALKHALDPADVLAPGRYDLRHEWPDAVPADALTTVPS